MLDSKDNSLCILNDTEIDYTYLKGKPRDILVIAHNTVQFDNKKCDSLDKSEINESSHLASPELSNYNCSENILNAPINLVFSKKSHDGIVKVMTKNNSNINNVNSFFRNEVSLLNSFNESLRHIQMVEDTLTSIRKSEDVTVSEKVVNLSSSTKSIMQTDIIDNPLITKFNVFADKYTMYSPMDKSGNNFHNEIRSQNRISYSEDETCGKKVISSKMSIHTTTFQKDNEFSISDVREMKRNITPQEKKLDPSQNQTHYTASQPGKRSECDAQTEMPELSKKAYGYHKKDACINNIKNTINHESNENSLVYDSYIETGIEQLPHETSSSFKSLLNNSNDVKPHMLHHLNRFCVFMMSQYMEDEKVRSEYLDLFLKVREKTLMDSTRSEILCLEIQKKYSQEQIPYLKKKQRGLLVKLQQERNEIKNMKKFQHERSNERKDALKRQLKYFKAIFSTESRQKDVKKPTNKSNILLNSKSVGRNSPIKAFSLSLNTDSNSHNSSISDMNEIIEKKKQALALQKKKMNDLLLSHYDLQMDAAEIKAMEDRIKDSKTLPDFSDFKDSIDMVEPQDSKTPQKTSQSSNIVVDGDENCEKEISSPEISIKSLSIESPKHASSIDVNSNPNFDNNKPSNVEITSSIEVNLATSIMSIPCSKESIDTYKSFGPINGSNLNMLWRKITGEKVDQYVDSNYYEMSDEKLDNFFERAKYVALQNLLKLKTFEEVKSDVKTSSTDEATADNSTNVALIGPTEHIVDTISKPISNLNNAIHYSLKNDIIMQNRSENKKLYKLVNIPNYINHPQEIHVDEKCIPKGLSLNTQYENIYNCSNDRFSHLKSTTKLLNENVATDSSSPVTEIANASPDQSDSSESTARSLIEELAQFDSMVHMNSSYSETCDKSTTLPIQGSILTYTKNETVNNTSQDADETMLVQNTSEKNDLYIIDKSLPNLSTSKKDHEMTDDTSSLALKDNPDGINKSKLNHSCDVKNDFEIANLHHADLDSENTDVIKIDAPKKESFDSIQPISPSFDSQLNSNSTLSVIDWNNTNKNSNDIIQPNHIGTCKPEESLIHKCNKENISDQDDCRMLEQLVSNSSHLQNIMKKQNIEPKKETSPVTVSSPSQVCSDDADVSIDKSCNGLHKTDDNNDIKNTRHHDLISNTWDLMLSSPEPSPRDSPTGEYSPATAAFSVSLSRIDEELRKKQLAIELEIKALEQQQTQLPYCLVREIPDKPPPPYIPPLEDSKSPTVPAPKDSPAVAKPIIQVSTAIKSTCNWLWLQYSGERIKNINYTNFDTDVNLSKDNHYSIFLFDLCKETFEKEIDKRKSPAFIWEYRKVNLLKPGKTDICLVVENKVKKFLGLEIWPVKKNLITNWAQKRQDYINELLLKELYKEEINWANIEEVESEVKNTITDTILESLLIEVCKEFQNVF